MPAVARIIVLLAVLAVFCPRSVASLSSVRRLPVARSLAPAPSSTRSAEFSQPAQGVSVHGVPAALLHALRGEDGALAAHVAHDTADALAAGLARIASALAPRRRSRTPPSLGAWAPAVAALAGGGRNHAIVARALVQDVYERLGVRPDWSAVDRVAPLSSPSASKRFRVDYPDATPAPSPNYWPERRPRKMAVRYVVIHDTESGCAAALNWFLNPNSEASAHFLVCRDGRVYQLVHVADAAWHAGNAYINYHSIGIEHEGFAKGIYTAAQYRATASILRWIDAHDHLGLSWTRNTVFGHDNVPASDHLDPGPGWNWPLFMSLLRGGKAYSGGDKRIAVVLWPRAYVHACASIHCTIVGTVDWGEQFAVMARASGWVGIDYAGVRRWILAAATGSGSGTVVHITAHTAVVRAAPTSRGEPIGRVAQDQAYVSTLVDTSADRQGWWFIEYADRYGFVCTCSTVPRSQPTPTPTATVTATETVTSTDTVTTTPEYYSPPILSPPLIRFPILSPPILAPVSPTPTVTASPTLTATVTTTPTPTPTTSPTITATATMTPTETATMTPSPTLSPTDTPTLQPDSTLTPTPT